MQELEEFRYPFESVFEFFGDGYWLNLEGLHLSLGWAALVIFIVNIFLRKESLYIKFSTIYFSAFIFNNYSYSFLSLRLSEIFGVLAAICSIAQLKSTTKKSKISILLITIFFVSLVHALVIAIIYPDINPTIEQAILRLALIFKILVLGLVFLSFNDNFNDIRKIKTLIRDIVFLGCLSCLFYIIQSVVFISGILPFGTFWDAGFTGFPTFGSVSIERGHFAKLLVPLFPFFSFQVLNEKKYSAFIFFTIVSVVNFSASGQIFFLSYLFIFLCFYRNKFLKLKYFVISILVLTPISLYTVLTFSEQFLGLINKVKLLVFEGDVVGGRGVDVLLEYSNRYPLGISYGGSTLRTVSNLPEINSGINAFIAQYSFLGIIIVLLFLYVNFATIKFSSKIKKKKFLQPFYAGIFVSMIIYCSDILWFTPTIWLSLVLCHSLTLVLLKEREGHYQSSYHNVKTLFRKTERSHHQN